MSLRWLAAWLFLSLCAWVLIVGVAYELGRRCG